MDYKRKEKLMHKQWDKLHVIFIIMEYLGVFLAIQLLVILWKITKENLVILMIWDKIILFVTPICMGTAVLTLYEKIRLNKKYNEFLVKVEGIDCNGKILKSSILYIIGIFIILMEYVSLMFKLNIELRVLICYIQFEIAIAFIVFCAFRLFYKDKKQIQQLPERKEIIKENKLIHMSDDLVYISQLLDRIGDEGIRKYLAHELYTYAARAKFYKWCHYIFAIISLSAPAMATVINSINDGNKSSKIIVSILSLVATVSTGITGIVKFRESWIRYRSYCEILKREVTEYVNIVGNYANDSVDEKQRLISFYEKLQRRIESEEAEWKALRSSV